MAVGPRNATTSPDTGLRTYRWQGQDLPSVTSLRRLAGLPFALANWQVNQVLKAALDNIDPLSTMKATEGDDVARKWLRQKAMGERDTAANRGTLVHEAASLGTPLDKLDPEIALYVKQYNDFIAHSGANIVLSEKQVFNLSLGYAGSLDILLDVPVNGAMRLMVADIKTGKGLYADHALQLVAYALGEFVGSDDKIDAPATALLHKASRLAILHLSPDTWELVEIAPTPELFDGFKNLCGFAHWLIANPSIDTLITGRITK